MQLARTWYRVRHVHGVSGLVEQVRHWRNRHKDGFPPDTFDAEWGLTTDGRDLGQDVALADWTHLWLASRSNPTQPAVFHDVVTAAKLTYADWTFVDGGCGKGRAVLLASLYPWRQIVGIDFARDLIALAEQNLAKWRHPEQQCRAIRFTWGDLSTVAWPDGPLVIYFFNPCAEPVMEKIAKHLATHPAPCVVLYHKPIAGYAWTDAGFTETDRGNEWAIYRR